MVGRMMMMTMMVMVWWWGKMSLWGLNQRLKCIEYNVYDFSIKVHPWASNSNTYFMISPIPICCYLGSVLPNNQQPPPRIRLFIGCLVTKSISSSTLINLIRFDGCWLDWYIWLLGWLMVMTIRAGLQLVLDGFQIAHIHPTLPFSYTHDMIMMMIWWP